MKKAKTGIPYLMIIAALLLCLWLAFSYTKHVSGQSILIYALVFALIPLAYFLVSFVGDLCFFLTGLSLGCRPKSLRTALKGYFLIPKDQENSNRFWVFLLSARIWPYLFLSLFCGLMSITYKPSTIWFCFFQYGLYCSVALLLTQLLPLAPRSFPSAVSLMALMLKDDKNKQYLTSIYAINVYRKLNVSYTKMDEVFFLPMDEKLMPEYPDNPLFSLLWYHTSLKLFAAQDYVHFVPYGEHFLKSHPYLSTKKKNLIWANILFAELVTLNRIGKLQLLYTKPIKKVLFSINPRFFALRTRYAIDLLYTNDHEDARRVLEAWEHKTRFNKGRTFIQEEENLFQLARFQAAQTK